MAIIVKALIKIDNEGVAWIIGANTKVVEVVLDKIAYGWSPEEMCLQQLHLSLAQVHSALAYCYENKKNLDTENERRGQEAEALLAEASDPAFRRQLLERKNRR